MYWAKNRLTLAGLIGVAALAVGGCGGGGGGSAGPNLNQWGDPTETALLVLGPSSTQFTIQCGEGATTTQTVVPSQSGSFNLAVTWMGSVGTSSPAQLIGQFTGNSLALTVHMDDGGTPDVTYTLIQGDGTVKYNGACPG